MAQPVTPSSSPPAEPSPAPPADVWQSAEASGKGRAWVSYLVLAVVIGVLSIPTIKSIYYRNAAAPAGPSWREEPPAAFAEARQSGKPVLIDFTASWCPPCQVMKHEAWADAGVRTLVKQKTIPLMADVDDARYRELVQRYGISTIPAVLLVSADGQELRRASFMNADQLKAWVAR